MTPLTDNIVDDIIFHIMSHMVRGIVNIDVGYVLQQLVINFQRIHQGCHAV